MGPQKILILKPSSLGDVIQALPVLRLLRLQFPASEIHWWIAREWFPVLDGDPDLNGLVPFDRRGLASPQGWSKFLRSLRRVRDMRFDWVIDLQALARSALFAWLSRGKLLVGLDDRREGASAFYDLAVPRRTQQTHAVDWYLDTLPALKVPVHRPFEWLPVRTEARARIRETWAPEQDSWALLNPGARWPTKRWPAEHFIALGTLLSRAYPRLRLAVLGGPSEAAVGAALAPPGNGRHLDLTGKTSLPELIEWIRLADFIVTNDTGPMHIAAALHRPVVALFGPTNPNRTGPYGQIQQVLRLNLPCSPCLDSTCSYSKPLECLRGLSPATVFRHIQTRFAACLPSALT